jgi:hypothetical protein
MIAREAGRDVESLRVDPAGAPIDRGLVKKIASVRVLDELTKGDVGGKEIAARDMKLSRPRQS